MPSNLLKLLIGGFIMGWGPCLAHTAFLLLPYIGGTKTSWQEGARSALIFSLGRILALVILGGLATVAFNFINRFFPPHRSAYLYLLLAFFMVTIGIFIVLGKGFNKPIIKVISQKILNRGTESMLLLGFLLGISPCVPLVSVLTYIGCTAENIISGVLYALSFGIGVAVAPIVLGALAGIFPGNIFTSPKIRKVFQVFCGLVLIFFGLQLIWYIRNIIL